MSENLNESQETSTPEINNSGGVASLLKFFIALLLAGITVLLLWLVSTGNINRDVSYVLMLIAGMTSMSSLNMMISVAIKTQSNSSRTIQFIGDRYQTINHIVPKDQLAGDAFGSELKGSEKSRLLTALNDDTPLALANARIEIEKKLRKIANESRTKLNLNLETASAMRLLNAISENSLIPSEIAVALKNAISIANAAIHGRSVSYQSALSVIKTNMDFTQWLESRTSSASVRSVIEMIFRTDSDLDAFFIDNFPDLHRSFFSGMDRTGKVNVLLERIEPVVLIEKLRYYKPDLVSEMLAY